MIMTSAHRSRVFESPKPYVPPGTGKTCLVQLKAYGSQIYQDCDVYIGYKTKIPPWSDLPTSKWHDRYFYLARSGQAKRALEMYKRHILSTPSLRDSLFELEGKRLGCFCKNHKFCHGRVLLELLSNARAQTNKQALVDSEQKIFSFHGMESPLSSNFLCQITIDGQTFHSAFHAFVWKKAMYRAHQTHLATRIAKCRNFQQVQSIHKQMNVGTLPSVSLHQSVSEMYFVLKKKWEQVKPFRRLCLKYRNHMILHENENWFWGLGCLAGSVDVNRLSEIPGHNVLGWLIMLLTEKLSPDGKLDGIFKCASRVGLSETDEIFRGLKSSIEAVGF